MLRILENGGADSHINAVWVLAWRRPVCQISAIILENDCVTTPGASSRGADGEGCGLYEIMAPFGAEIGAVIPPSNNEKKEQPANVPARHLPIVARVAAAGSAQLRFPPAFRFSPWPVSRSRSCDTGFSRALSTFVHQWREVYSGRARGCALLLPFPALELSDW